MQSRERNLICKLVAAVLFVHNAACAPRSDPLVETTVGVLRGLQATDGDYAKFTGIPYATVDADNPFGAAIPHPGFADVFEATSDSALCPQVEEVAWENVGTLDCLQLNVYVPNTASSSNRLPVLVWIYGGGYVVGDAGNTFYGPSFLVRHDVILVTLNYRLGPYGFMCLHTPEVPGNQGLKDQQIALNWIRDNIEAFGGDVDKITLFGQSAGGISVDLHLYFNEELRFDKVIFQSGTSLGPWAILEPDLASPIKLANQLGFATENVEDALTFLAKTDAKLVIGATQELGLSFRPCIEQDFDNVKKFMGANPLNTSIARNNYSMLIGHTNDEAYTYRYFTEIEFLRGLISQYLDDYFNFNAEEMLANEQLIRQFYLGDQEITDDTRQAMVDFDSDLVFNYPTVRSVRKYLENGANSVYQYMFSYNGDRNLFLNLANADFGKAAHGDEIGYLFTQTYNPGTPSSEDQVAIDRMTTLWTNFAKYGNPTPETNALLPVSWTPVTKNTTFYMNIDAELSIEREPFAERMAFWEIFYQTNEKAQKGYEDNKA